MVNFEFKWEALFLLFLLLNVSPACALSQGDMVGNVSSSGVVDSGSNVVLPADDTRGMDFKTEDPIHNSDIGDGGFVGAKSPDDGDVVSIKSLDNDVDHIFGDLNVSSRGVFRLKTGEDTFQEYTYGMLIDEQNKTVVFCVGENGEEYWLDLESFLAAYNVTLSGNSTFDGVEKVEDILGNGTGNNEDQFSGLKFIDNNAMISTQDNAVSLNVVLIKAVDDLLYGVCQSIDNVGQVVTDKINGIIQKINTAINPSNNSVNGYIPVVSETITVFSIGLLVYHAIGMVSTNVDGIRMSLRVVKMPNFHYKGINRAI